MSPAKRTQHRRADPQGEAEARERFFASRQALCEAAANALLVAAVEAASSSEPDVVSFAVRVSRGEHVHHASIAPLTREERAIVRKAVADGFARYAEAQAGAPAPDSP